jgi:hypothetical protein
VIVDTFREYLSRAKLPANETGNTEDSGHLLIVNEPGPTS